MSATGFQRRRREMAAQKAKKKKKAVKLQKLSYEDLKSKAKEMGIGFEHNIKKTDLIELIEGGS